MGSESDFSPTELRLFAIAFVATVIFMTVAICLRLGKRWSAVPLFPPIESVKVLFLEQWTSGRSFRTFMSRFGGARNCMRVVVTEEELWITLHWPFRILAGDFDLEHRIMRADVTSMTPTKRTILIDFKRVDGGDGRVELILRRPDLFLEAMNEGKAKKLHADPTC